MFPALLEQLQLMSSTLLFWCSRKFNFPSNNFLYLCMTLWLKAWSAEHTCKKCLVHMPFDGRRLFRESPNKFIKKVMWGKRYSYPTKNPKSPTPMSTSLLGLLNESALFNLPMHWLQNHGLTLPFVTSPRLITPPSLPRSPTHSKGTSPFTRVGGCLLAYAPVWIWET